MIVEQINECFWRASSGGDGDLVVASAITGYYKPNDCANPAVIDGAFYHYRAESDDLSQYQSGKAPYDVGTSTLQTTAGSAVIFQSSNSGSQVTFSAAPRVRMTAAAQDVLSGRWELIEETVIGSPVTQVEHAITNPDDYWQIMLDITGISVDADEPAIVANLLDASVTLTDTQEMLLYPNGNTNSPDHLAITVTLSANLDDGRAFSTWTFGNYSMGGTPPLSSLKAVYSGGSITELDTALHDITSGRLRTFGLRK